MQKSTFRTSVLAISLGMLAACGGDATEGGEETAASTEAPAEIAERQANFEGIGDAFKVIRGQLEGGEPDFAAMETAAADINARLQRVPELFPAGSSVEAGYDTEALAAIWEDREGFDAAAQNAVSLSEGLIAAVATGDGAAVGDAAGKLGVEGCKACHDKFRLDTD